MVDELFCQWKSGDTILGEHSDWLFMFLIQTQSSILRLTCCQSIWSILGHEFESFSCKNHLAAPWGMKTEATNEIAASKFA